MTREGELDDATHGARHDPAPADASVVVAPESIERSNVNTVDALVSMIAAARQFDTTMKLLDEAGQNATRATQLLSITS